jgi:predicted dehydrogenase
MLVEFGKAGWIGKARQQPEKVRMVLDKIRTDGLLPTLETVFEKLDRPLPLGYCNVGRALEVGVNVPGVERGQRVVSNGRHAEIVSVPRNLLAVVPASVTDDEAAFTVLGAVALQGVRLLEPRLGEAVAVIGLGLVGLLAVQILRANGCRVIGLDPNPERVSLVRSFGVEGVRVGSDIDALAVVNAFSRGRGVDGVLITASTTSNEPIHQAALMCRKRGRIVLVGAAGLELARTDFYEKELTFQVSCSYGPGRYDPSYEEKGNDYPVAFVRWTEQRNFEAVLDMLADGRIDVAPLISHRFPIERATEAYDVVTGDAPSLGIVLEYPQLGASDDSQTLRLRVPAAASKGTTSRARLAFIGAGNYAQSTLIPAFQKTAARLVAVVSSEGVSGLHAGRRYGFEVASTNAQRVISSSDIDAVIIATRHDTHASLVCEALMAGKAAFVEKPLAISMEQLDRIRQILEDSSRLPPVLSVGFNRRFAPQTLKIHSLLSQMSCPKSFVVTVNAGQVPGDHWVHDPVQGGGRILGEACHFVDLLRFLAGARITHHEIHPMRSLTRDTATITLSFEDGSLGTINYFSNGSRSFPKERLEVFAEGRILQLDNFRRLRAFGWPGFRSFNLWRQDKGQAACAAAFIAAVTTGGKPPIPYDELLEVSRVAVAIGHANE